MLHINWLLYTFLGAVVILKQLHEFSTNNCRVNYAEGSDKVNVMYNA